MEQWKMFYHNGKLLGGYTLKDTFEGEEQATKELFASENGIDIKDIEVRIEER